MKELEKILIELGRLEIKIKRIKGGLEEFEIKRLEMETEVRTEILKKSEKKVRMKIKEIKKSELELEELEMKITTEKELEELEIKRINKLEFYCSKLPF